MCLFMVLQIQLLAMSVLKTAGVSRMGHLPALPCGLLFLNTFHVGISRGFRYHTADLSTILLCWTLRPAPAELSGALVPLSRRTASSRGSCSAQIRAVRAELLNRQGKKAGPEQTLSLFSGGGCDVPLNPD